MDIKNVLFALSESDAVGCIDEASRLAHGIMQKYTAAEKKNGLTVIGTFEGKSDYTIMIDAHIDQIAMIVTDVDENGFLTVGKSGGIDIRTLPARPVTVHGKEKLNAVFCSTPPHLSGGETEYDDIAAVKLDTGLGGKARELVSVGDYVTFSAKPVSLSNDRVSGRSFDDRSGVVCLLALAEKLAGKELPCRVAIVLSDAEELGMRGVRPAAYDINPDEAIAVDVSFGSAPEIPSEETGRLSGGPMIGVSPALDTVMSEKLMEIASQNGIPYQTEAMGETSGTNADMIAVSRGGVKTCTVSIPLRNMHTDTEVLSLADLYSTCDLLEKYILSGGVRNA